jgi:hypothetical protein
MRKRKLMNFLLLSIISILLVNCNEENDNLILEGKIEFKATAVDNQNKSSFLKSNDLSDVTAAIVTIEDENGVKIYESKQIDIYEFNDAYITEPLSIITGTYSLTSFYLIDSSESVIYASPVSSSPMAYLVDQLLPISFNVSKDEITTLEPEVLSTEGYTPVDFGYVNFGLNEVEIFDFLITVFRYNSSIENFELTDAEILITSEDDTLYTNSIEPITNKITIRDGYINYNISLTKSGYKDYNNTFTYSSLKEHFSNPLTVIMETTSLTDGLVAYYPFDGNTNDNSGNGNNAINYGATLTTDRFENFNSAYKFDGSNDYMRIDHTEDLNFDSYYNSYSISFWVKGDPAEVSYCRIIEKWNELIGTDYPFALEISTSFKANIRTTENYVNFDYGYLWDNNWKHIILVVNSENKYMSGYVNNSMIASTSYSSLGTTGNNEEIYLAGHPALSNKYFNGYMDDVRFYNRVLTEDEIQALYHENNWDL